MVRAKGGNGTWYFFIAASLAVAVLGLLLYLNELSYPAFGMSWHSADGEIYAVGRGGAADQVGIQDGDRVLTLEGAPLAERKPFRQTWRALVPGDVAAMEIARGDDVWIAEIRTEKAFPFFDGYAVYYIVAAVFWLAGMLVFFSLSPDSPGAGVYLLFCLSACVALYANTRINVVYTAWSGLLQRVATGLSMGALLHFSLLFPEDKRGRTGRLPLLLAAIYLPGLILGLAAGIIVAGRRFELHWISNFPFATFGLVFAFWVLSLWHTYRTTAQATVRTHLREMAGGMTLTLLPFVALVVPGAVMGRAIVDMRLVATALAAFPLALTYAIFRRHPRADLNLWVRRGFVILGLGVIFSVLYGVSTVLISWLWWDVTLSGVELTIGWLAALPAALLIAALRPRVSRWVQRWFFTSDAEIERRK